MEKFNCKGLSIIEITLAFSFFMVLIIPFIAMFITSARDIKTIGNMNVAILFAQEAIEACKGYPVQFLDEDDAETEADKKYYLENAFKTGEKVETIFIDREPPEDDDENPDADIESAFYWHTAEVNGVIYTRDVIIEDILAQSDSGDEIDINLKYVKVTVRWNVGKREVSYTATSICGGRQ